MSWLSGNIPFFTPFSFGYWCVLILSHFAGVSSAAATGLLPVPPATDTTTRDGRQNKKSKWDKVLIYACGVCNFSIISINLPYFVINLFSFQVDGDRRNPLPSGGQDSISAVGAHAALLSANAGAGYMAFA